MSSHLAFPIASVGPLGGLIDLAGLLAVVAWVGWRFGPTLARVAGWGLWWGAWACGSQGGYAYCAALLVLGSLSWAAGTVWYAKRRGHWPSAISARVFTRLLGKRNPLTRGEPDGVVVAPPERR